MLILILVLFKQCLFVNVDVDDVVAVDIKYRSGSYPWSCSSKVFLSMLTLMMLLLLMQNVVQDPILTAFELSWELRRLAFSEHEFKSEYLVGADVDEAVEDYC